MAGEESPLSAEARRTVSFRGLVLLDRDGVLNEMVVDAEHGTIDSPLHPSQVELLPGVPAALARLTRAGFTLAIVTNQPSAAKGKTTRKNLEAVHGEVLARAQAEGARIASSHLCFHRAEDRCSCRKPKPGLLDEAFAAHPDCARQNSWMVGDGVTDLEAGQTAGVLTAFIRPLKCDQCRILSERGLSPRFQGPDLPAFVDFLLGAPS